MDWLVVDSVVPDHSRDAAKPCGAGPWAVTVGGHPEVVGHL